MNHPITLLFGLPRSGTTWIGKIFDSHPNTLYRHEPDSGGALRQIELIPLLETTESYRSSIQEFVGCLASINTTRVAASLPLFPKRYYPAARFIAHYLTVVAAKAGTKFFGELSVPPLVDYRRCPQMHIVWKSIESVGRLGVIVRAVPNCRAILIMRHPCGYVASVVRGESLGRFTDSKPSSDDYGVLRMLMVTPQARAYGLSLAIMKSLHPVERLAWRWVLFNEKALDETNDVYGCTYVRYEDLCANPLQKARDLFAFAGLSWHRQSEKFVRQSISRTSETYYSVFKNPDFAASRWQNELPAELIDLTLKVAARSRVGRLYLDAAEERSKTVNGPLA